MNTWFRTLAISLILCIYAFGVAHSQLRPPGRMQMPYSDRALTRSTGTHRPMMSSDSTPSFNTRKADWKKLIDAYWGPGDPYAKKLSVFDTYVSYVRAGFPAFVYSKLNWDSVAAYWRVKITDSTSRGAFAAILGKLAYALDDWHAYAGDDIVESMPLTPGTPGVTLLDFDVRHFGAALTPLADKSLLVYKAIANHPLGLERGDRVLGYEGALWPQPLDELFQAGIGTDFFFGGYPPASEYIRLAYAGMCWHLFDTIDVIKYSTGQTVHLPTAPLKSLDVSSPLLPCDQMPIPGVPMPSEDLYTSDVTYGIVQGTNIGYIYVRHHQDPKITPQFDAAVLALDNTDGLIIDLRLNAGGRYGLERGIARLVNFGDSTMEALARYSASDFQTMVPASFLDMAIPSDVGTVYNRPIAVLIGPQTVSWGNVSAYELTYVPGVRFFGKSPAGSYTPWWQSLQPSVSGYTLHFPNYVLVDHRFPEVQLWDKKFPVDEEVWLSPGGVARGEDDVVKRAIAWITTGVAEGGPQVPSHFTLSQNYPNPFNPSTTIKYDLPSASLVSLKVYDILGREVSMLVNDRKDVGVHEVKFDGSNLASGMYFYRLQAGEFVQTKRLMILR
jgi:hypothetical protein